MPGPYHDFLLLSLTEHRFSDYTRFINDPRAIQLEDDLLRYIANTLEWIPTHNPAKNESHRGLCFYGPTVIHTEGASAAAAIFCSWADLFACGPKNLIFTGGWAWIEGDPPNEGEYEKLIVDRDDVVGKLQQIANYAKQIVETDGDYFILHWGV